MMHETLHKFRSKRIVSPDDAVSAAPSRPARSQEFVKLPTVWKVPLHSARNIATWNIATELLARSFKEHRQTIRLANVALAAIGITPKQKWRALAELEKLGLVRVDRRSRKSPDVTLLYPRETGE